MAQKLFKLVSAFVCSAFCLNAPLARAATGSLTGLVDLSFNPDFGSSGGVWRILPEPGGKIYVHGFFSQVNGTSRDGFARLNQDGTLDLSFDAGEVSVPAWRINTLALAADGKLLVGGSFTNFASVPATGLVRLNRDGSVDRSFPVRLGRAPQTEFPADVYSITALPDGRTIVAGDFSFVNEIAAPSIAILKNDGSLDRTFDSTSAGSHSYYSVAVQADGKILAGGLDGVFRFNRDGSRDDGFANGNRGTGKVFRVVALPSDRSIISVLDPISINGRTTGIVRLRADGSLDESFPPFGSGYNHQVRLDEKGRILLSGILPQGLDGYFVRMDPDGALDHSFGLRTGSEWFHINSAAVQSDGKILIVGDFKQVDGFPRSGIARLNETNRTSAIYFASTNIVILESETNVSVSILRGGNISRPARVCYRTENETASAGTHYRRAIGAIEFPPGEQLRTVSIPLIDDYSPGFPARRTFNVILADPSGDAILHPRQDRARVVIGEVDYVIGVEFERAAYPVNALSHYATLTARRTGPSFNGNLHVDYSTEDITARAGEDYEANSGTLVLPGYSGRGSERTTLVIRIFTNEVRHASRTFRVALRNPRISPVNYFMAPIRVTAALGQKDSAAVTITGNEVRQPSLELELSPLPTVTAAAAIPAGFVLESSTNLTDWFPLLTNAPWATLNFSEPAPIHHRFYRALPAQSR